MAKRKSHVNKEKGKTSVKKTGKKSINSDREKSTKRSKGDKTKKPTAKTKVLSKQLQKRKPVSKGTTAKRASKAQLRNERRPRGKEQQEFTFKGSRNIEAKNTAFVEQSDKALKSQMKRRGGKPPKGVVLIFHGKSLIKIDGKLKWIDTDRAFVSDYDFVVNEKNIKKLYVKKAKEFAKSFERKMSRTDNGNSLSEDDSDGIFDPDKLTGITIKYIY